jgi:hypothetical protein
METIAKLQEVVVRSEQASPSASESAVSAINRTALPLGGLLNGTTSDLVSHIPMP